MKNNLSGLRRNTEKYITFTVLIGKELPRIDNDGEEIIKNISYILQFIDSARFMASSLSNLFNNFSPGINRIKCKYGHDDKNVKHAELNINIATVFLNIQTLKMI